MDDDFITSSFVAYIFLAVFNHYQMIYARDFRGSNKFLRGSLLAFGVLGILVGYGTLIYIGFQTAWHVPVVMLLAAMMILFVASKMEPLIPEHKHILGLLGFIVVPIAWIFMLHPYL